MKSPFEDNWLSDMTLVFSKPSAEKIEEYMQSESFVAEILGDEEVSFEEYKKMYNHIPEDQLKEIYDRAHAWKQNLPDNPSQSRQQQVMDVIMALSKDMHPDEEDMKDVSWDDYLKSMNFIYGANSGLESFK